MRGVARGRGKLQFGCFSVVAFLAHFKRALRAARATIWGHKINHSYDPSDHSSHDSHTGRHTVQVSGRRETEAVAVCEMFDYLYATTWLYPISNSCN